MTYKIEKGIPVSKPAVGRKCMYPFKDMDIGDSFFVQADSTNPGKVAYQYGLRHNKTFTYRMESGGVRIWRTA